MTGVCIVCVCRCIVGCLVGARERAGYVTDTDVCPCPTEQLLSKDYAATRRAMMNPDRAFEVRAHVPAGRAFPAT
jgi:gamma-glutamyltranspeptidase